MLLPNDPSGSGLHAGQQVSVTLSPAALILKLGPTVSLQMPYSALQARHQGSVWAGCQTASFTGMCQTRMTPWSTVLAHGT